MTATMPSSISTGSNLDFYLDDFPPPRPSTSRIPSPLVAREPTSSMRPTSIRLPSLRMSSPSVSRCGLPSNPRSPHSPRCLEKGVRRFTSQRPRNALRGALFGLFQNRSEPDLEIPIQEASPAASTAHEEITLPPWPPLHIEKRPMQCPGSCHCATPKRKKRRRLLLTLLIILLLYLLGDSIFLNARVLNNSGDKHALSPAQESCLTQFTVNAPANASLYPCSTCLGILQDIPDSFKFSTSNEAQTLSNSLQFCGLQSLVVASSVTARDSLTNGGWVQNVQFCTWTGIQCDGQGNVKSLEMVFPAVPSVIPSGIGALSFLQSLQIIGGNSSPAGALPDSFANLTSLTSIHLESTALSPLPSSLFQKGQLDGLTSLTLVKNSEFAGQLSDVSGLALESFCKRPASVNASGDTSQQYDATKLAHYSLTNFSKPLRVLPLLSFHFISQLLLALPPDSVSLK
ncbi:hypothetical protein A7U60_g2685 [Sanghuangporus baumii]|uniref:Leucine-rich repeat-containing N-terminal plant-type domain-containing protein n=1 Tax=Sanghuangporus baumii TaxID=108892 RepID=A0A9Q5I226_SANBA|nr:hypothetical protein A7U60_g2685 [Sanghuangporus baumii]